MTAEFAENEVLDRRVRARRATVFLALLLATVAVVSLAFGPSGTSLWSALWKLVAGKPLSQMERVVLWVIRAPRLVLGVPVGASLAVSGAVMQGLFRNPLADPGLVGVSAGAGLGAVTAIVLGGLLPPVLIDMIGQWTVPIAAFLGGWGATLVLYRVSTHQGRTSVATMLLAGIALGALA